MVSLSISTHYTSKMCVWTRWRPWPSVIRNCCCFYHCVDQEQMFLTLGNNLVQWFLTPPHLCWIFQVKKKCGIHFDCAGRGSVHWSAMGDFFFCFILRWKNKKTFLAKSGSCVYIHCGGWYSISIATSWLLQKVHNIWCTVQQRNNNDWNGSFPLFRNGQRQTGAPLLNF